jgi:hypothetical protein
MVINFSIFLYMKPLEFTQNTLKGPKHEISEIGFFTQIRPVRVGDLGTSEKKKIANWSPFFKVFDAKILLSV